MHISDVENTIFFRISYSENIANDFHENYSMNSPPFDILQTTNIFTNYD